MNGIPTIREEDIERQVGRRGLQRGWDYFRSAALVETYRQGQQLKAACLGSGRHPYQISIDFDDQGIRAARCTCPIGEHGHCKHVAAVLVCWREAPDRFLASEAWEDSLGRCSREQLWGIIKQLLEDRPELRRTVESLVPPEETLAAQPIPPDRAAVLRLDLQRAQGRPEELLGVAAAIKVQADRLADQHEPLEAAGLYQALLRELIDLPGTLDAQHPELIELVQDSAESLANQLASLNPQAQQRYTALRVLVDLFALDVRQSALCLGIDLPRLLLPRCTHRERQLLADWIGSLLASSQRRDERRRLGALMLEFAGHQLDEQAFEDLCRRSERWFDLVRYRLRRGELDRALEEADRAEDEDLARIAELLVLQRHEQAALQWVQGRLARAAHPGLNQWLEEHRRRQRQRVELLEACEKVFRLQPTMAAYRQVRGLAKQLDRWDALREPCLQLLREARLLPLLVRIYLEENDLDQALAEIASEPSLAHEMGLALRVAKAAERLRPSEAGALYRQAAERHITRGGREHYVLACRLLRKAHRLGKEAGQSGAWQDYLRDLQHRHRRLSALLEEMDKAGLLKDTPS